MTPIPETCPGCGASIDERTRGMTWICGYPRVAAGQIYQADPCRARQAVAALRERAIKAEHEAQRLWRLLEEATPQGAKETL